MEWKTSEKEPEENIRSSDSTNVKAVISKTLARSFRKSVLKM